MNRQIIVLTKPEPVQGHTARIYSRARTRKQVGGECALREGAHMIFQG